MTLEVFEKNSLYKALRANQSFTPGDVVVDLNQAQLFEFPDFSTIDLGDCHVYHPMGRYINHSCEPNTYVDWQRKAIIAREKINGGDEVTFNYLESERQIESPFDCVCLSSQCVGRVEKRAEV